MAGYIKDHRKELESDIWLMPPLYHRTWQWLKYNVNHADNEIPMRDGTRMLIKRGQRLTSVRDIAKGISWYEGKKYKEPNPKTVSAILEWMIKTDMILINRGQGNREYTLITLINYEIYNEKESQGNSKVTPDGEGGEQQADINKNDKECLKNEKNITATTNPPEIILQDEFCRIHAKGSWNLKQGEYKHFAAITSCGIPLDFIILTMTQMHEVKKAKNEKVTSFSFYYESIIEAWEAKKGVIPLERSEQGNAGVHGKPAKSLTEQFAISG